MSGFDISKYREMFVEEAEELFESADNVLLEAENNGTLTDEEMSQLFRDVHTLKGSGASVELTLFAEFTHDVENMMDKLRNHEIEFIPEMAGTLIDGLDVMKELLDLEVSGTLDRATFEDMTASLLEDIRAYISGKIPESATSSNTVVETEKNENFGFYEQEINDDKFNVSYGFFKEEDFETEDGKYGFFDEELDKKSETYVAPEIIHEDNDDFGFFDDMPDLSPDSEIIANNEDQKEELEKPVEIINTKEEVKIATPEMTETPVKAATPTARIERKARPSREVEKESSKKSSSSNIRVNLDKIDLLMNNANSVFYINRRNKNKKCSIRKT
jgi:two-component system chemotaxis sensor kinase CheA